MLISPSASGPTSMPTMRNTATSGIFIFCASKPVMVPRARMSPQDSSVCFAISIEVDANSFAPRRRGGSSTLRDQRPRGVVEQLVDREPPRDDLLLERVLRDQ